MSKSCTPSRNLIKASILKNDALSPLQLSSTLALTLPFSLAGMGTGRMIPPLDSGEISDRSVSSLRAQDSVYQQLSAARGVGLGVCWRRQHEPRSALS